MNKIANTLSYWVMAALVTVLGLLGIVLAAGAQDAGMQAFGLALAAFAVIYDFFAIHRTHEESAD
ncbi:hypothetical protein [uncultured Ferrovibrio sp.]|jgi:predicted Zn-dependent protease|uniref:hypothetical protein n=1 Tax=uncultured Ferrovibrio sp. TaxID=1576913 RepID=UPI002635608A|nr:hypothetical protein [uncultured Ferrovibrio sp.]